MFAASASADDLTHSEPVVAPSAGRYVIAPADQPRNVISFISSRTGMTVKRPSIGAEGFVLDHYDRAAIESHLHAVGDKLLSAFGANPPYAVFSDSLEDYGSDWTPKLLDEFQRRRGYDLRPHLLALIGDAGPETAAVRHDWGQTLSELANENYLVPIHAWAPGASHPVPLADLRISACDAYRAIASKIYPRARAKRHLQMGREFSDTRWAASAGHLFHHPVISSEAWTWLHSPVFRATPVDMKAEADLHFLQGLNQLTSEATAGPTRRPWLANPDGACMPRPPSTHTTRGSSRCPI